MLFNFIWKNRINFRRKSAVMTAYENGGLNFLDFATLYHTFKINWIKSDLKNLLFGVSFHIFSNFGGLNFIFLCNYNVDKIPVKRSASHKHFLHGH